MLYISHLLDDDSMKELIGKTGLGIESIEFSIAENLDQMEQKLQEYEKRLAYMGARELTLHGPFLDLNPMAFDSLVQEATRVRYEQTYEVARRLGAKKIIFHAGFIPSVYFLEGWSERMVDFYERFLEDKSDEIEILMENVLDPLPGPIREVAEQIRHPAFGLCLDIGHAHCYSEVPVDQWIHELFPYIRHLHLHDNMGNHDSHLALGAGSINLEPVRALMKSGTVNSETVRARMKRETVNSDSMNGLRRSSVDGTFECRTAEDVRRSQQCV